MQDYKLVYRAIWNGASIYVEGALHVQNAAEFVDELNANYLSNGYKVMEVNYLGELPVNELEQSNSPRALRYTYHLVKELEPVGKASVK